MESQENLSFICEKALKASKVKIFSWLQASRFGFQRFFIAFRLDSLLNKQKIIKKKVFLKMIKIASFRPNHKTFSGSVARSELKKIYGNS
jgi:hypothetical protein